MDPFTYTPLQDVSADIRLFQLFPGDGPLRGQLRHLNLEAARDTYHALSYCWGSQSNKCTIHVNDRGHAISSNLHDALLNIRQLYGEVTIWIDALCINQDDTREKNRQVAMMKSIYMSALATLVWLGPSDNAKAVFEDMKTRADWVREHGKCPELAWPEWRQSFVDSQARGPTWSGRLRERFHGVEHGIEQLVSRRPWFSRCWVIQEVAVSSTVTVLCGQHRIGWADVEATFDFDPRRRRASDFLRSMISIRRSFRDRDATIQLGQLLWNACTFQATDPRDRIFGLLGLVSPPVDGDSSSSSSSHHGVHVDYDTDVTGLYTQVTAHYLTTHNDSGILAAGLGVKPSAALGPFPSWVLNPEPHKWALNGRDLFAWSLPRPPGRRATGTEEGGWRASGLSSSDPKFGGQNRCLLGLEGIVVDVIERVGSVKMGLENLSGDCTQDSDVAAKVEELPSVFDDLKNHIECYFEWRALAGVGAEAMYRGTAKTTEQAFYEIMCPRRPGMGGPDDDAVAAERHLELCQRFDGLINSLLGPSAQKYAQIRRRDWVRVAWALGRLGVRTMSGDRETFALDGEYENLQMLSDRRRAFKTASGYVGLGGPDAAAGDRVALLAGSGAPFVLRLSDSGRYRIVSDACVVGMMDGELWDTDKCGTIWLE